jgi:hypothetical protein
MTERPPEIGAHGRVLVWIPMVYMYYRVVVFKNLSEKVG